jgi:hypothetical protein
MRRSMLTLNEYKLNIIYILQYYHHNLLTEHADHYV